MEGGTQTYGQILSISSPSNEGGGLVGAEVTDQTLAFPLVLLQTKVVGMSEYWEHGEELRPFH